MTCPEKIKKHNEYRKENDSEESNIQMAVDFHVAAASS